MRPDLARLPGLYEHARVWWAVGSAWRTWSWAIRPWVFARKVTLQHEPRVWRLLLWLPVLILPLHAVVASTRSLGWIAWPPTWLRAAGRPNPRMVEWQHHRNFWTTPIGHFQSSPWIPHEWGLSWYSFFKNAPLFPWVGVAMMLSVPATLMLLTTTRARSKVRVEHLLRCTVYGLAWAPLPFIVTALNAVHTTWLTAQSASVGTAGAWRASPITNLVVNRHAGAWLAAVVAWSAVWWWYAVVHVLKLHQARLVWFMMMLVALLVGGFAALFFGPEWMNRWLP